MGGNNGYITKTEENIMRDERKGKGILQSELKYKIGCHVIFTFTRFGCRRKTSEMSILSLLDTIAHNGEIGSACDK